jgi:hypothetical protein
MLVDTYFRKLPAYVLDLIIRQKVLSTVQYYTEWLSWIISENKAYFKTLGVFLWILCVFYEIYKKLPHNHRLKKYKLIEIKRPKPRKWGDGVDGFSIVIWYRIDGEQRSYILFNVSAEELAELVENVNHYWDIALLSYAVGFLVDSTLLGLTSLYEAIYDFLDYFYFMRSSIPTSHKILFIALLIYTVSLIAQIWEDYKKK